ncbi:rod shape-determining protein MreC [Nemorincola caseinilytica]|uniref:Cell shape-determining protein MreC n=1 Tax=Nemorincola caseinilytica TaxID=2054315 RepID=A0ABP8NDS2_9BACT
MRNFIFFIRRFFNLILFLVLEVVCIVMIQRTATLQGNDIVSSANAVSGLVYKKKSDVAYYFGLRRMNDSLLRENARLRQNIAMYNSLDTLGDSVVRIDNSDTAKHIVRFSEYIYRTARVINNSTNATDNYITLNRGTDDGVYKSMAVISGTGVVGRVEHVSRHFASVLSVLSSKQKVSAKLKSGNIGVVIWEGRNPTTLVMTEIPQQVVVKKGDSVVTSNLSLYFPPGVLIGTVVKTEQVKKNTTQRIYLRSSTNFQNLQYVYVVENKMAQEKDELEETQNK